MGKNTLLLNKIIDQAVSQMSEDHEGREDEILRIVKARVNKDARWFFNRKKVTVYDYRDAFAFMNNCHDDMDKAAVGSYVVFFIHGVTNVGIDQASNDYTPEDLIYYVDRGYSSSVALVYRKIGDTLDDYINAGLETCLTDLREANKEDYSSIYARREERHVEMVHVDNDMFQPYDLAPYNYTRETLPVKDGFQTICLDGIMQYEEYNLPLDDTCKVIPPSEAERALPYIEFEKYDSPLYHIISARNGQVVREQENTRVIDYHAIIISGFEIYYFNPEFGAARINSGTFVWRLTDDSIIVPQYLLLELQKDYAKKQYQLAETKLISRTRIYIPEGDRLTSLSKQMQIFGRYRTHEVERLTATVGALPDSDHVLPAGSCLKDNEFVVERCIGKGGFGNIYKAGHRQDDGTWQQVAIKELYVDAYCKRRPLSVEVNVTNGKEFEHHRQKFCKEHELLKRLNAATPYVPRMIGDVICENNTLYYAMQYLDNGSLADHCYKTKDLSADQILQAVCQAGIALNSSHCLSYMHLDVTPYNIMLGDCGEGILIDFGNTKHYLPDEQKVSTSGYAARTDYFAPPEMISQSKGGYYPQTDVYGLAVTLYSALTGELPDRRYYIETGIFVTDNIEQKLKALHISEGIIRSLEQALRYNWQDRYATVKAFLMDLSPYLNDDMLKNEIGMLSDYAPFNIVIDGKMSVHQDVMSQDYSEQF